MPIRVRRIFIGAATFKAKYNREYYLYKYFIFNKRQAVNLFGINYVNNAD